ncbi:SDR family NAD(P)-dependent oxidoreductase [Saccharicrinis sp. FJH62]|uniref:SDR family NAD(P)-dependent oxidoreductase n=1 Tax=Saccharicrinis sp. FJH62 TaxID=3344657 RepID=UPI0035D44EDF
MASDRKFALITGASKGFGRAIAIELASRKHNLLLLSLKNEGLEMLCQQIRNLHQVEVNFLEVDFMKSGTIDLIKEWTKQFNVNILVNNAGLGGTKKFHTSKISYIERIIQINIRTVAVLTHTLLPQLMQNEEAYVLNIASMAAFSPIGYKTVYPASKAFIYSFSRGLSEELRGTGVSVTVIFPGPIRTNSEIISRIEKQGWWVHAGLQSPEKLAKIAINNLLKRRKVIVPGVINKINWLMIKIIPPRVLIPMVSKRIKNEIAEKPSPKDITGKSAQTN